MKFKLFLCAAFFAAFAFSTFAADEPVSADNFLRKVRRMPIPENWAKLSGEISHKRRGQKNITAPIYMALRAAPNRVFTQLSLSDTEIYTVAQVFGDKPSTTVLNVTRNTDPKLPFFGIKPDDLTFSFLYWDFSKELEPEHKKMQSCRVFELQNPGRTESVKVWISESYAMPMRVEWYRKGEEKHYRALEISGVSKENNGLWLVSELSLDGQGWRTRVEFSNRKAGTVREGVPTDLFKTAPSGTDSVRR